MLTDLVITNGKVITVDDNFSMAQAVAVKDGKIVAVGTNGEVAPLIGKNTMVSDLKGRSLLPGINDSHIHVALFGATRPPLVLDVGFPAVRSIAEIVRVVAERVAQAKPGEWIQGRDVHEGHLDECLADPNRHPARWDLDIVSPENPVCLTEWGMHALIANSKALKLAGITKETPDPPGGKIEKEPVTGEPTGKLKELAQALVTKLVPPWTEEQQKEGIILAMKQLNALGITSATDPGVNPDVVRFYQDVYKQGKLTVRMSLLLDWLPPAEGGC